MEGREYEKKKTSVDNFQKKISSLIPVLFLVVSFLVSPDRAVFAQNLNLIVFTSYYEKDGLLASDLYSMNPDGSAKKRITDFYPYYAREPSFSTDGKYLAFTSNLQSFKSADYEDIFKIDLATSAMSRVTGNEYISVKKTGRLYVQYSNDTGLELDEQELMVSYQGVDRSYTMEETMQIGQFKDVPAENIWVKVVKNRWIGGLDFVDVPAGGIMGAHIKLTDGNFLAGQPSWSADDSRIAGRSGLAYYDPDALNMDGSPKEGRSPYAGVDTIGIWDTNGQPLDRLDVQPETMGMNIQPSWSPDGTKIAYCKGPFPTQSIVVVPADNLNGPQTVILHGQTDYSTLLTHGYLDPVWSPDGTRIACVHAIYDTSLNFTANIVIADSSGSGEFFQVTDVSHDSATGGPDFSPDGQWLAYSVMVPKGGQLNVTDLMTMNLNSDIYIRNIATGEEMKVTDDGASGEPAWNLAVAQPAVSMTTTSTVPASGTTTINEGEPSSRCPFSENIRNPARLFLLRQLRPLLAEKDGFLVDLFCEFSTEVSQIIALRPGLKDMLRQVVRENTDSLRDLVADGKASVTERNLQAVTGFLRRLRIYGSPELKEAIDMVVGEIESKRLLKRFGIKIKS